MRRSWLAEAVGGGAFLVLALLVRISGVQRLDSNLLLELHRVCSVRLTEFMLNLNAIAGPKPVYAACAVIGLCTFRLRGFKTAGFVVVASAISGLLNLALRELFHRHRPELWRTLIYDHSFIWSFPSGHACLAASLGTIVTLLLWDTRYRLAGLAFAIVYSVVVAATTLVLGVHNPTDVLGGWISGWLAVALVWRVFNFEAGDLTADPPTG